MNYTGTLKKMQTELNNQNIDYFLLLEHDFLHINQLLNKFIHIKHIGFQCLCCGKRLPIFRQGHCKSCFFESPATADWVMKPELSTAHLDKGYRDLAYEKSIQLQPHIVYVALTSGIKVGVTRKSQIPTRWIDQGALQAIAMLEVPNRYLAGVAEVALKSRVSDKTSWQKMLTQKTFKEDLQTLKKTLKPHLPDQMQPYYLSESIVHHFSYPMQKQPEKVKSLNLEKTPKYEGTLKGIKGQYLIFEDNTVFNVRSNGGSRVTLTL